MAKSPKSKLAALRAQKNLSQQQLAELVGAHWITISKLERGKLKLTFEWARKISEALSVELSDIFDLGVGLVEIESNKFIIDGGDIAQSEAGEPLTVAIDASYISDRGEGVTWYFVNTNDFYPSFRESDLLRLMAVNEADLEACIGRLCLVEERDQPRRQFFGILGLDTNGQPSIARANGAVIKTGPLTVQACATMIILSPAWLGNPRLSTRENRQP